MIGNIIIGLIIVGLISLAVYKIVKDKRAGAKCIGCPYAGSCTSCQSEMNNL